MYFYQPCLLTMALYAWAFDPSDQKRNKLRSLLPLAILAVSEAELSFTRISLYPAGMALPILFLMGKTNRIAWAEVLTASLLGGLLCWKAADTWPLHAMQLPLCSALLLIIILLLCRRREDRLLSCAIAGMFFELFFCLREYMLFSFCVMRVGSRDGLCLSTSGVCLLYALEQVRLSWLSKQRQAVSIRK